MLKRLVLKMRSVKMRSVKNAFLSHDQKNVALANKFPVQTFWSPSAAPERLVRPVTGLQGKESRQINRVLASTPVLLQERRR